MKCQHNLVFPTNIVINFRSDTRLRFDQAAKDDQPSDDLTVGKLTLPNKFKSAWIIDGQHRLFNYFHKDADPRFRTRPQLPVIAFENLSYEQEADLCIDINSKQVKVSSSLLLELNADVNLDSTNAGQKLNALASKIALELGRDRSSPIFDLIKTERATPGESFIALPQLVKALGKSSLIGTVDSRANLIVPGVLYGNERPESTIDRAVKVISSYLRLFSEGAKEHWNLKHKRNVPNDPGGHLCTSLGVATLILLLGDLVDHVGSTHNIEFRNLGPDDFVSQVQRLTENIIEFFQKPTSEDIQRFRIHRGSEAAIFGMREMQSIIRDAEVSFDRPGLDDFLHERETILIDELNQIYRPMETDLLQIVLSYLKNEFGETTDGWFINGTPAAVRQRVLSERDKQANEGKSLEECFTMTTDAKLIFESYRSDFQSLLKAPDLRWLDELQTIRNGISHAPYDIKPHWISYLTHEIQPMIDNAKRSLGLVSE